MWAQTAIDEYKEDDDVNKKEKDWNSNWYCYTSKE
jgi:hypothetical protein